MRNDVLVIEDDPTLGTLFKTFLSFDKIDATVCQRGDAALKRINNKKLRPSLVILDMHLPDMSGEEIFAYLQKKYPQIEIMIVTADSNLFAQYSNVHPKTFHKPLPMEDFRAVVQSCLF
jgi:two-component system repressor protein LuxO